MIGHKHNTPFCLVLRTRKRLELVMTRQLGDDDVILLGKNMYHKGNMLLYYSAYFST